MKNLLIIGARGYGREVFNLATMCDGYLKDYKIKGFLDDNDNALENFQNYPPIISSVEKYEIEDGDIFVCALGSVYYKKKYTELLLQKNAIFINLIHPTTSIYSNVNLGVGLIIFNNVTISCDSTIDDFVTIQANVAIGHDTKIGKWTHINAFSFTGGFTQIEPEVTINTRSTILPNLTIGTSAIIGAGSVVLKSVKSNTTVFGNPARKLDF